MRNFLFIFLFLSVTCFSQENDFRIGMFSFRYAEDPAGCYKQPYETIGTEQEPTSQLNVLSKDGFNTIFDYQIGGDERPVNSVESMLRLAINNNLKVLTHSRQFYKPPSGDSLACHNTGVNTYDNWNGLGCGGTNNCSVTSFPIFWNSSSSVKTLYSLYTDPEFKDHIWGHQISEEASYYHWKRYDHTMCWYTLGSVKTQIPPSNIQAALTFFKNQTITDAPNQKYILMEANHNKCVHANTIDGINGPNDNYPYNPQDYISLLNKYSKRDVYFEGSYIKFEENAWKDYTYSDIFLPQDNWHYLGKYESIEYAKNYVSNIQSVLMVHPDNHLKHIHSNALIENYNWLWNKAYCSIIHGAKGLWFWDLPGLYLNEDAFSKHPGHLDDLDNYNNLDDETVHDRFAEDNFPFLYKNGVRYLSQELRYLVDKGLISSQENTIVCTKTTEADENCILPPVNTYITSNELGASSGSYYNEYYDNEKYGLRYTIRSNGEETIMIIANVLPVAINPVELNFNNLANPIIQQSTGVDLLFSNTAPLTSTVTSSTYKINRNSNINLDNLTVLEKKEISYINQSDKKISLAFGPLDVHIIKFKIANPLDSYTNGWSEVWSNFGDGDIATSVHVEENHKQVIGDFDGDGAEEILNIELDWSILMSYNGDWTWDWSNYGNSQFCTDWTINNNDRYFVADFDNDNKDELLCVNKPHAILLEYNNGSWIEEWDNGGNGLFASALPVEDYIKYLVGDFDNDNKAELLCIGNSWVNMTNFDNGNWQWKWSNYGSGYIGQIPVNSNNKYFVGNYDGNTGEDLLCINGSWARMEKFGGSPLQWTPLWNNSGNNSLAGWGLSDIGGTNQIIAGNINDNSKDELFCIKRDNNSSYSAILALDQNDELQWGWSNMNVAEGQHPYINNWPIATQGNPTHYHLIEAEENLSNTKYLLAFRQFGSNCKNYQIGMYQRDNNRNSIVQKQIKESVLQIYPNPNNGMFSINTPVTEEKIQYEILNTTGKIILSGVIENTVSQINISNYPNGIYLFKCLINGEKHVKKFIKE